MFDLEIGTASEPSTPFPASASADPDIKIGTIEPEKVATIEADKRQEVFTAPAGLDPVIDAITVLAKAHKPDVSSRKGREAIASLAMKVARCKVRLDDMGKELVDSLKTLPRAIDANRKTMRERLDALRDEIRRPLDEWEAAQVRLEAERRAQEEGVAQAKEVAWCHEIGLLMDAKFDQDRLEELRVAGLAREEHKDRIALAASEKARKEAEDRAAEEHEASLRREAEARAAVEKAEGDRLEAERRAREAEAREAQGRQDAEDEAERARVEAAEQTRKGEERAERERLAAAEREEQARIEAAQAERHRADEQARKEREAKEARERDKEHRRRFNVEAMEDLMKVPEVGLTPEMAQKLVIAIATHQVRNVTINY